MNSKNFKYKIIAIIAVSFICFFFENNALGQDDKPIVTPKPPSVPTKPIPKPPKPPKPNPSLPSGVKEITIFSFEDNTKIQYQYKGSSEIETLGDTAIVGLELQQNTEYILWVTVEKYFDPVYHGETERFVLYKQIKPVPAKPIDIQPGVPDDSTKVLSIYELPDGKVIQTSNSLLTTGQWIEDDGSISIKMYDESNLRKFKGNIYGFTFIEGGIYILEVKKVGDNYIFIRTLYSVPTKVSDPTEKKYPNAPPNLLNTIKSTEVSKEAIIPQKPNLNTSKVNQYSYPVLKINSLDSAIWNLRYLYQEDGVEPHTFTDNDELFQVKFDKFLNKVKGSTTCNTFEANLITDNSDKFDFFNLKSIERLCNTTKLQQIFFSQIQNVNRYEISDNKLSLYKDTKMLLLFEGIVR
jgi:heat shock protein HslJ